MVDRCDRLLRNIREAHDPRDPRVLLSYLESNESPRNAVSRLLSCDPGLSDRRGRPIRSPLLHPSRDAALLRFHSTVLTDAFVRRISDVMACHMPRAGERLEDCPLVNGHFSWRSYDAPGDRDVHHLLPRSLGGALHHSDNQRSMGRDVHVLFHQAFRHLPPHLLFLIHPAFMMTGARPGDEGFMQAYWNDVLSVIARCKSPDEVYRPGILHFVADPTNAKKTAKGRRRLADSIKILARFR